MAGKVTFLHGTHATRVGGFIPPAVVPAITWRYVKEALGREITEFEREEIECSIAKEQFYRAVKEQRSSTNPDIKKILAILTKTKPSDLEGAIESLVSDLAESKREEAKEEVKRIIAAKAQYVDSQAIKKTLVALSKLDPGKAEDAFEDCDIFTIALIRDALRIDLSLKGGELLNPSGENITAAAKLAQQKISGHKGGNPGKGYHRLIADDIVRLWQWLEGAPCAAWAYYDPDDPVMTLIVRFGVAIFTAVENSPFDSAKAAALIREAQERAKG